MYVTGDIRLLAALARPTIGVVTAVRPTHLRRAGSLDAIERGKRELVEALPGSGTAVLNVDDPLVDRMRASHAGARPGLRVRPRVPTSAATRSPRWATRACASCSACPTSAFPVRTPALGRHSVHNALAAAAVGLAAGLGWSDDRARAWRAGFRAPHRTHLVRAGTWRILDDSYNAAPDSMAAALDLLAELPGRRVAVLGEMLELGPMRKPRTWRSGRRAATLRIGWSWSARRRPAIAAGALAAGMASGAGGPAVPDREEAVALLLGSAAARATRVLVKASRGAQLDQRRRRARAGGGRAAHA